MEWIEEQLAIKVRKLVDKYGLEGAWETITYMPPDENRWYMKIIYKTIYKGIT